MKGIAVAAAGLLIAGFVCPGKTRAQQSPDKKPKLTLGSIEAQVVTLQGQVATLQTALNALHPDDFAVVASNGALVSGSSSVMGAVETSTGEYVVVFTKDISQCGYVATIGDTDSATPPTGEISVATDSSDVVFVETDNSSGTVSASPFHLSVICP